MGRPGGGGGWVEEQRRQERNPKQFQIGSQSLLVVVLGFVLLPVMYALVPMLGLCISVLRGFFPECAVGYDTTTNCHDRVVEIFYGLGARMATTDGRWRWVHLFFLQPR